MPRIRPVLCDVCGKMLSSVDALRKNIKRKHTVNERSAWGATYSDASTDLMQGRIGGRFGDGGNDEQVTPDDAIDAMIGILKEAEDGRSTRVSELENTSLVRILPESSAAATYVYNPPDGNSGDADPALESVFPDGEFLDVNDFPAIYSLRGSAYPTPCQPQFMATIVGLSCIPAGWSRRS